MHRPSAIHTFYVNLECALVRFGGTAQGAGDRIAGNMVTACHRVVIVGDSRTILYVYRRNHRLMVRARVRPIVTGEITPTGAWEGRSRHDSSRNGGSSGLDSA